MGYVPRCCRHALTSLALTLFCLVSLAVETSSAAQPKNDNASGGASAGKAAAAAKSSPTPAAKPNPTAVAKTPPAGAGKRKPIDAPETRTVTTKDNVPIRITYYKSSLGKEAPVVVLLHMKDGNRFAWQGAGGFAEMLQNKGFAVITVDLRHHGESKVAGSANQPDPQKKKGKVQPGIELRPADYEAMIAYDMEAVKKFIFNEHQAENLNMNKMGIVGPEMGAAIAANYALVDWLRPPHPDGPPGSETPDGQDVRALVLISPQNNFHGVPITAKVMSVLNDPALNVGLLFVVGKNDSQDKKQASKFFEQSAARGGKDERVFFASFPGAFRGTDLLGRDKKQLEETMLKFFEKRLRDIDAPWRDRESRLNK